jgi:hypothetical protein
MFALAYLPPLSLHSLRLLFLLLQNVQYLPPLVKLFLPVLFLDFPASCPAATFLEAVLGMRRKGACGK